LDRRNMRDMKWWLLRMLLLMGINAPAASRAVLEVAAAVPAAEVSNVGEARRRDGDGYQLHARKRRGIYPE
jgi:hypothetical protein